MSPSRRSPQGKKGRSGEDGTPGIKGFKVLKTSLSAVSITRVYIIPLVEAVFECPAERWPSDPQGESGLSGLPGRDGSEVGSGQKRSRFTHGAVNPLSARGYETQIDSLRIWVVHCCVLKCSLLKASVVSFWLLSDCPLTPLSVFCCVSTGEIRLQRREGVLSTLAEIL